MKIKTIIKNVLFRIDPAYRIARNNQIQMDNLRKELLEEINSVTLQIENIKNTPPMFIMNI